MLSSNKKMGNHDAFAEHDHFGKINSYLDKHKKTKIIWAATSCIKLDISWYFYILKD